MARAYAHLAERERILNYIDNRKSELEEHIDILQSQNDLFVVIARHYPECTQTLTVFTDKDKLELSEERFELAFWKSVREKLNPCKSCSGYGEVRVFDTQDESHMEPCNTCNRSGIATK